MKIEIDIRIINTPQDIEPVETPVVEPKKKKKAKAKLGVKAKVLAMIVEEGGDGISSTEMLNRSSLKKKQVYNSVHILKKDGKIISRDGKFFPVE